MRIFRKTTTVDHEQVKQQTEQSNGESDGIPVFKGQGKRKTDLPNKSKSRNTLKHG